MQAQPVLALLQLETWEDRQYLAGGRVPVTCLPGGTEAPARIPPASLTWLSKVCRNKRVAVILNTVSGKRQLNNLRTLIETKGVGRDGNNAKAEAAMRTVRAKREADDAGMILCFHSSY
jgi:hypothetical protein